MQALEKIQNLKAENVNEEMFDLEFNIEEQSNIGGDVEPNTYYISVLFSCANCM